LCIDPSGQRVEPSSLGGQALGKLSVVGTEARFIAEDLQLTSAKSIGSAGNPERALHRQSILATEDKRGHNLILTV
jgi:hypothetical protein